MGFLKNGLKEFDMFGKPISLFFYGKKKYNSSIGGCLTLSMVILILILSNNLLTSIIYRTEVYLTTRDQIETSPPKISFKNRFAINVDPSSTYTFLRNKTKYFDVLIGYGTWSLNSTGQYVLETTYYNLTFCNESHFPMFTSQQFQNLGLGSSFCPEDPNLELDIKGSFDLVNQYNYVEVTFQQCISRSEQEICANSSEIEEFLKTPKGEIYLDVFIINNVLDSGNYENPFTPFVDKITNVIGLSTFKQLEVYLTPVTLLTDPTRSYSYFRDKNLDMKTNNFMYERKSDMFYDNKPRLNKDREVYLSMYIQSSILSKIYQRSYDTFGDYCQQVGSLYSIFSLIFGIINNFVVSEDLNIKISKSLYDFKKSRLLFMGRNNPLFLFADNSCCRKMKYLWDSYLENRRKHLMIDKVITKELDLTQILMKIKEIETLKKVLFTKDQKIVFNSINKPKFKNELKIQSKRDLLYKNKILKRSFLPNVLKIQAQGKNNHLHQVITASENLKKEETAINKRILKMLDEEEFITKKDKSLREISSSSKSKRIMNSNSRLRQGD